MNTRIIGSTFVYPHRTLEEGLQTARNFGFRIVDVGVGGSNGHIDPVQVAQKPEHTAEQFRSTLQRFGMVPNECFTLNFGPPINSLDPPTRFASRALFSGLAKFAQAAGFKSILLIPGPIHEKLGQEKSLNLAIEALQPLVEIADSHDVSLHVEADCESCARTPEAAEELCTRVPGLKLTLDYSHFIFLGFSRREVERLHPFTGHVHARQASAGRIVELVESGAIDYARVLQSLDEYNYDGLYCVEYLSCEETDECGVDVAIETPKMITELERLLDNAGNRIERYNSLYY